jgi:transposase
MTSEQVEPFGLKVVKVGRDGKRRYDRQTKQRLVESCLMPGVSVAGLALKHGVNANLLRRWIKLYQQRRTHSLTDAQAVTVTTPFIEVVDAGAAMIASSAVKQQALGAAQIRPSNSSTASHLSAQMPNGVTLTLECGTDGAGLITAMIDALGRCDVSSGR